MLILPSLEQTCAKAVLFASHSITIKPSIHLASDSWLLLCHQWPCFSLCMWCFFLVYLALTLGFHSRTLAWLWTGSSWEHSEYNDSLRINFPSSNELDQPQVGLIGQRIQLVQKSIERWEYSLRLCEKFEHMQNHYLNSLNLLLGKNRICKSK